MKGNRGRDTRPEVLLRRELYRRGLRYRVHHRPLEQLRCRADVVFLRARVAVFVDGCFWHGCAEHAHQVRKNAGYWAEKVARNRERDSRNDSALAAAGWVSLRVWEHESPDAVADRVQALLRSRTPS